MARRKSAAWLAGFEAAKAQAADLAVLYKEELSELSTPLLVQDLMADVVVLNRPVTSRCGFSLEIMELLKAATTARQIAAAISDMQPAGPGGPDGR